MLVQKIPILAMTLQSGVFARLILVCLLLFSIASWAIVISKWFQMGKALRMLQACAKKFHVAENLDNWMQSAGRAEKSAADRIAKSAVAEYVQISEELEHAGENRSNPSFLQTQFSILHDSAEQAVAREMEQLDWGLTFLAVISSVAPFIGLLGTVWGITHSFYEIGSMGSANINVVAPGIAEALITTIFGLVVAIPCAIFYNLYANQLRKLENRHIDLATSLTSTLKSALLAKVSGA